MSLSPSPSPSLSLSFSLCPLSSQFVLVEGRYFGRAIRGLVADLGFSAVTYLVLAIWLDMANLGTNGDFVQNRDRGVMLTPIREGDLMSERHRIAPSLRMIWL